MSAHPLGRIGIIGQLIFQEAGVMALAVAIVLPVLLGLAGLAVDLGGYLSGRSELQNAADAAALAGVSVLVADTDADGRMEGNYSGARNTSINFVESNPLHTELLVWDGNDVFEAGLWEEGATDFTSTGPSHDPDNLTAVRVTLRKFTDTYFARIFGFNQFQPQASATAYLGWPGEVPEGVVTLPIVVDAEQLYCGDDVEFEEERGEKATWTTFNHTFSPQTATDYVNGIRLAPALKIGDIINIQPEDLDDCLPFRTLEAIWSAAGEELLAVLPVGNLGRGTAEVVGFLTVRIWKVFGEEDNGQGYCGAGEGRMIALCDQWIAGSKTGGPDFGSRAARPILIR